MFSAGIDLEDLMAMATKVEGGEKLDVARRAYRLRNIVENLQDAFTAIERTPQPVIAAVHSGCIGGGVDLVCACDIRICSQDAYFQVKEVDVGITADVGTLQRLPKILGSESLVRELCYTARKLKAPEAMACGFVSRVYPSYDALLEGAFRLAHVIAGKSPIAVAGTKEMLTYARDHSVDDGLRLVRTWNMAMVQSQDIGEALAARAAKRSPIFAKL
jgi:delta(3,5)-delta(2,4)-dienoyl-CoA isomerase